MFSAPKVTALSNRVYCILLHLYPAPFRREYGTHMAQLFRDNVRDTLQDGGWLAVTGLFFVVFLDLFKTAVDEHVWEVFHMPLEKLTRWSGPAAAIGGLLYAAGVASIIYGPAPFILSLLVTVPLLAVGLFGLYRRLPLTAGRLNNITFAAAVSGLLLSNMCALILVWLNNTQSNWDVVVFIGLGLWIMGFASMGVIAIAKQALGNLSFTPLIAVVALTGMGALYGTDLTSLLGMMWLTAYAISWLLLGIALWQAHRKPSESGLIA